jgi:hypothetical protein
MKKESLIAFSVLSLAALACSISINLPGARQVRGSGNVIMVERPVSNFNAISLSGMGDLKIELGDEEKLIIQAEDNILEYIEIDVKGGVLSIGFRSGFRLNPQAPINYFLTVKALDSIAVSGLGKVDAPALQASNFKVQISGSGSVELKGLKASQLDVQISGLGNLAIGEGKVEQQSIDISGSGDYRSQELQSASADLEISGLGNATVWVDDRLSVKISGSGVVEYAGDPQEIESEISGAGKLEKIK